MRDYLLFAVLGLGSGAIYAGLALGLVVQYKASSVINFAYGAIAMLGAYMFDEVRSNGDLMLPWVGLPHQIHVGDHSSPWVAGALVLPVMALFGLAIYYFVLRPLRDAPTLARVVAMIGLLLAIESLVSLQYGTQARSPSPILPSQSIRLLGVHVPRDRLYLTAAVAVLGLGLWAFFRFARTGLALRAAAESERGALVIGISPDRLGALTWSGTAVIATVFGILIAPITGLDPGTFALFVVPALAAALIGRLTSLAWAAVGGLVLGIAQSELGYLSIKSWFPSWAANGGAATALPFVVIVIVLLAMGRRLPRRGELVADRALNALRRSGSRRTTFAWLAVSAVLLVTLRAGYRFALMESLIGAIIMLSFVVLTGYLGQISLAQAAFAGVGGFTLSRLGHGLHIPFPFAPLLAALCGAALGLLVAIAAVRVRGVQLAVVTLAASLAMENLLFDNRLLTGSFAAAPVPEARLFGQDIGPYAGRNFPSLAFGVLCLVVLGGVALAVGNLRRSGLGRRMLAVRSNEQAAAAIGIDIVKVKLAGFAIASFIAALGGAMTGYLQIDLSAGSFTTVVSIELIAVAYLGGITSVSGAFVGGLLASGGLLATFSGNVLHIGSYYPLLSGLGVIVTAVMNPEGIADRSAAQMRGLWRKIRRRSRAMQADLVVD